MATYTPQGIDFADRAPVVAQSVGVIAGTREEVWAALCDHERWTDWMPNLKSCRATSTPASGVGSTRVVTLAGGLAFTEEFIAWDEPERWAFTGVSGPPMFEKLVERVTLVELGPELTEITYRMAIGPRRGFATLVKLARPRIEKSLKVALRNLNQSVAARRPAADDVADDAHGSLSSSKPDDEGHDHPHDHDHPHEHDHPHDHD